MKRTGLLLFLLFVLLSGSGRAERIVIDRPTGAQAVLANVKKGSLVEVACNVVLPAFVWQLPEDCVIRYAGGCLHMAGIVGNRTQVESPAVRLFQVKKVSGTWNVETALPEWFGAVPAFGDAKPADCSAYIDQAILLDAPTLRFSNGNYGISRPVIIHSHDICIARGATLKALGEMNARVKDYQGKDATVHSLIYADFLQAPKREVYGLQVQPRIYGGGCLDGDYKASVGLLLNKGYRVIVRDLTFRNFNQYGFVAALSRTAAGSSVMQSCTFINDDGYYGSRATIKHHPDAKAILNNRYDCVYEDITTVNYRIAVVHEADNGKFTNVHSWLRDGFYWENSIVFDCYAPDVTLVGCEADTMQKLIMCHKNFFFASVTDCRAYKNPDVVSDELARRYPPLIVDKGDTKDSQVYLTGGDYWFEVPYRIINNMSAYDHVSIRRYNRNKVNANYDNN